VDDIPDHLKIKLVVFMDDDIAHAGHFSPRNVGMLLAPGGREAFGGFADDGDLVKDGG
jgi:hypothetical protein